MRGLEAKHYALLGAFLVTVGTQLGGLQHGWLDAMTPSFIGGLIGQIGLMLGAIYVGAPGATGAMTDRRNPDQLPEATGVSGISPVKDPGRLSGPPAIFLAIAVGGGLLGGAVAFPACASHMPAGITTPAAQAAYRADEVVARFKELSDVVKADTGNQPGMIRPADAFTIIEWITGDAHAAGGATKGVVQIIQEAAGSQSWKAAAKASWTGRIRAILGKYPALAPYLGIIDELLEVL